MLHRWHLYASFHGSAGTFTPRRFYDVLDDIWIVDTELRGDEERRGEKSCVDT